MDAALCEIAVFFARLKFPKLKMGKLSHPFASLLGDTASNKSEKRALQRELTLPLEAYRLVRYID